MKLDARLSLSQIQVLIMFGSESGFASINLIWDQILVSINQPILEHIIVVIELLAFFMIFLADNQIFQDSQYYFISKYLFQKQTFLLY